MTTVINLEPLIHTLTREQFRHLCQSNPDVQLERSPQGELIIMSPVGGESGNQEATLITKVGIWNEQTQLGYVFSSSTIFSLPNGSAYSLTKLFGEWHSATVRSQNDLTFLSE